MQVKDIMTTEITTVSQHDNLQLVDDIMATGHIRHVPVAENSHLVGIVSQRELFSARLASTIGIEENAPHSFLHTFYVSDVMTKPVFTISPDASISDVATRMMENGIGCLLVVKEGQLEGIVTKTDLLRYLRDAQEALV